MSIATTVSVLATATLLAVAEPRRRKIVIHNAGGASVFIGYTDGVTAVNGIPLADGETWSEDGYVEGPVYAITASGTNVVRVQTLDLI